MNADGDQRGDGDGERGRRAEVRDRWSEIGGMNAGAALQLAALLARCWDYAVVRPKRIFCLTIT